MTNEQFDDIAQYLAENTRLIPDEGFKWADHEGQIERCNANKATVMEEHCKAVGFDNLLRLHYLDGAEHPHDYNLPLNKWDSTPD